MKLSKTKKIILLIASLGILTTSIVTPIFIINIDNDEISKEDSDKKDVQKIVKIIEEKSTSQRQIQLASDVDGKIIAKNKQKIITKIEELIGKSNLNGVSIEVSIKKDKEISIVFEKIIVKISKGNYSQELSENKTISVRRIRKAIEIAAIDVKEVAISLKALRVKTVEVYIKNGSALKITDNKNEILEAIKKLEGYKDIDFKEVNVDVKNSNDVLPKNNQSPIAVTLILSKSGFNIEVSGFKVKQMSALQIAKIDVNHVKTSLENLNQKIIQVDTGSSSNQKISTNKTKILAEIKNLQGYSSIKFNGVKIEVKTSQEIIPGSTEEPISFIITLSKNSFSLEVLGFKVKSLSNQQVRANSEIVNLVKSNLENLNTKIVEVYTSRAADLKITTNKIEILKEIKKLRGYSDIELKGVNVEVKNSETLLQANNQTPIAVTLILSKPGISIELTTFKAKQMSLQRMANIDINFAKNALNSLKTKIVEINSFDSVDQKITTNKAKILAEIKKIQGYSNIDFNGVNVEVKNSETLLPTNDQNPIAITLVLSKVNASPNNIELTTFSAKQQFDVIAKIEKIENKIIDKDILIAPNVATSNKDESLIAIRNQLKKENPELTNEDLAKISLDNEVWSLKLNKRKEATLTIALNNIRKSINVYVAKGNSYLFINSKINDGWNGKIFQDSFENLWAMTKDSKLQVLKKDPNKKGYVETGWTSGDLGLTKNSNINNGQYGTIFQDSFGNLWAMAYKKKLQVLKVNEDEDGYVETGWTSNTSSGLTKSSNITNGRDGIIFQDDFGNLWAMGQGKKLQVLKVNSRKDGYVDGWTSTTSSGLTKNSNITNIWTLFGFSTPGEGKIFQDSFGNLWTMGYGSKLQVLKVNSRKDGYIEGWTSTTSSGLTKSSSITNGGVGKFFQDYFGNLWSMGFNSRLQVLKVNSRKDGYIEGWTSTISSGLTKSSNITNGSNGTIFQDSFKNLWAMGDGSKLQVLKVNSRKDGYVEGWTSANSGLTKNSNITDGWSGTIFQDSFGNLWSMGKGKKLQVLKVNSRKDGYIEGWTSANSGLTKNSNITDGENGTIFQDSFDNLWAMGDGTKLQVLRKDPITKSYIDSWENF